MWGQLSYIDFDTDAVMRKLIILFLSLAYLLSASLCASAATVSCEVQEVKGSTLILKNCDTKRLISFKKGSKVKVKTHKGTSKN